MGGQAPDGVRRDIQADRLGVGRLRFHVVDHEALAGLWRKLEHPEVGSSRGPLARDEGCLVSHLDFPDEAEAERAAEFLSDVAGQRVVAELLAADALTACRDHGTAGASQAILEYGHAAVQVNGDLVDERV